MRLTHGEAWVEVDPVGAIIADATLRIDGRFVRPFFQNPWRDDLRDMDMLTRHLGGEWVCVPFGVPQAPDGLPTDWRCAASGSDWHQYAHGFGAHSVWRLVRQDKNTLLAEIAYPDAGPIAGLRRRICLAGENEIQLSLEIDARSDARIPVGLHPVISLEDAAPGAALIGVAGEQTAWTFPLDVEPGRGYLRPDQRGVPLSSLTATDGAQIDGTRVPYPGKSEDLVLLTSPGGLVSLTRSDLGYRVDVEWDDKDFPNCLLWLSNRGRDYAPWDGRVCAVGIEPVAAAFDLGVDHSISTTTPLAQQGVTSSIDVRKGDTWTTSYCISVHKE